MHAEKVQFSAPDRRRFAANFKAATEFRCWFGANSVPVFSHAWKSAVIVAKIGADYDLEMSDPNYDAENTRVAPNLHKKSSNLHWIM